MQGCAQNCLKFILVFLNLLIFLCGVGLIVTGTFLALGFTDWIPIEDVAKVLNSDLLRVGAYVIIAAGCFVVVVAGFGCFGACCENKCLLGVYFVFLLLIFCAQLAAGILAAIYSAEIEGFLTNEGQTFLMTNFNNTANGTNQADSYANELATAGWIAVQKELKCCGVDGATDYSGNIYTNGAPDSCYEVNVDGMRTGATLPGCKEPLKSLLEMYATVIGATAIGVACLELFCMVFAVCLCRNVGQDE